MSVMEEVALRQDFCQCRSSTNAVCPSSSYDVLLSSERQKSKSCGPANKATLVCISQAHWTGGLGSLPVATGDVKYENEDYVRQLRGVV